MQKPARVLFFLSFLFFHQSFFIYASQSDVVINEFLVEPTNIQWVEVYNKGEEEIDISGWIIDDSGGKENYTITGGTKIKQGEFLVFESGKFNFNSASADTVRILNGENIVDSKDYTKSPGENISIGRITDGGNEWGTFSPPTKKTSNNTSSPLPTGTPTPTAIPTSMPTPTSTKVPTPTKTPIPTKTPTPPVKTGNSPTTTNVVGKQTGPTPTKTGDVLGENEIHLAATENIQSSSSSQSDKPTEVATGEIKLKSNDPNKVNLPMILFILGGMFLISTSFVLLYKKYQKIDIMKQ